MSSLGLDGWVIANACLEGIFIMPLFIIWVVSFCVIRQRDDPVRRPFHWMKAAYPLLVVALIYRECIDTLGDSNTYETLFLAGERAGDFGAFIESLASLALLICLVELGISFLFCSSGAHASHNILRWTVAGLSVVLVALAIARVGEMESYVTDYYNAIIGGNGSSNVDDSIDSTRANVSIKLSVSFDIIGWVAAAVIAVLGSFVMHKCRATKTSLRSSAIVFFVATLLNLLRNTWRFALDVKWVIPRNFPPEYINVVDAILDVWTTFVVLILIFAIGCRNRRGLWSTQQPWMANQGGLQPDKPRPASPIGLGRSRF